MQFARKVIQAMTVAVPATLGAQGAIFLNGPGQWDVVGLGIRVGIPSALAALVLFPVSPRVAASRTAFVGRVLAATLFVAVVNRALVFDVFSGFAWPEIPKRLSALVPDPANLDPNATSLLAAIVLAGVLALVTQPLLHAAAKPPG